MVQIGQLQKYPLLCFSSATGYHAGGKDANAPMAGGTDKFKYDTGAKVAE